MAGSGNYYYNSEYSNGGEEDFRKSNTAYERALLLDPNLVFAAGQLITNRAERGELVKAYQEALVLLDQRPESALAHFHDGIRGPLRGNIGRCDAGVRHSA